MGNLPATRHPDGNLSCHASSLVERKSSLTGARITNDCGIVSRHRSSRGPRRFSVAILLAASSSCSNLRSGAEPPSHKTEAEKNREKPR
jgi:hypothetical protein